MTMRCYFCKFRDEIKKNIRKSREKNIRTKYQCDLEYLKSSLKHKPEIQLS